MQTKNLLSKLLILCFLGLLANSMVSKSFALDLEPGTWSHLPIGINVAGLGYAYTEADINFDPTLLLEGVKMEMHTYVGKYVRTFELFDKSARIDLTQGYQEGEWKGLLNGVSASTSRDGLTDSFLRFAVNLYGAPPLKGKAFANYRSDTDVDTIFGMALVVRLPTGEYMNDKLINLGGNRFAFRPQLGVIHNRGKWTAEITGEVAFYTENDEFYNNTTREQEPLYIIQNHLTYTFRPGLWVCASVGYDYGGENSINGIDKNDTTQNIAWAFSFSYPINRNAGIKVAYISSHTQELVGFDSDTIAAGIAFSW